jgi:hypothetical protein
MNGWTVHELVVKGQLVGQLYQAGSEFHTAPLVKPMGLGWRLVRNKIRDYVQEHGFATTRVEKGDAESRTFQERVGFTYTWSDDRYEYFILARTPGTKRSRGCPQQYHS